MSNLLATMQAERFKTTMQNCANVNNLRFQSMSDGFADMILNRDNDESQHIMFNSYDSTIEFLAIVSYDFSGLAEMPGLLSTHLLHANATTKLGFWSASKLGENYYYSVIYNAEIDQLTPKLFVNVILDMLKKVDEFEQALAAMSRSLR